MFTCPYALKFGCERLFNDVHAAEPHKFAHTQDRLWRCFEQGNPRRMTERYGTFEHRVVDNFQLQTFLRIECARPAGSADQEDWKRICSSGIGSVGAAAASIRRSTGLQHQ